MKIIVCIKQIPDTNDVKWSKDNNIIREGVISVLNPYDYLGIQTARRIKEDAGGTVTLVTMGPKNAEKSLRYGLSMGCDEAYLLSDKKFSGADTLATAKTLFCAIKNVIKDFDLIITGQFATDGDTAQTPYSLANLLNIPSIGYVSRIDYVDEKKIIVTSAKENGRYKIKGEFPLLVSISDFKGEIYTPKAYDYIRAQDIKIKVLNSKDILAHCDEIGIKGSLTYVSKAFKPQNKRDVKFIDSKDIMKEII